MLKYVDYSSVIVSSMVKIDKIDLPMQVLDCINLLKKAWQRCGVEKLFEMAVRPLKILLFGH